MRLTPNVAFVIHWHMKSYECTSTSVSIYSESKPSQQASPRLQTVLLLECNVRQIFHFFFAIRDFLPRGSGIVTRRPLVLQLNYTKKGGK